MFLVYILRSNNLSYIGMTNDFLRRWQQHNNILKGGAKYTTSKNSYWEPISSPETGVIFFNINLRARACNRRIA